jgi:hypothetical protein
VHGADKRIIGLPSETRAWGKNDLTNNLEQVSRVTYGYDEGTFSQEPNQIIAPTRHDTANYGSAFITRGNPTSTTRWEVPNNVTSVTSQVRYDIAGSPVAQIDPLVGYKHQHIINFRLITRTAKASDETGA